MSHDTQKSTEVEIVCSSYEGNNVENYEWEDPYLKPAGDGVNPLLQPMEKEPAGLELWLNSLDTLSNLDTTETHMYHDPFYSDTGHFEQGEWIFDYECKFFENLEPCSDHMERDNGNDCGVAINLESTGCTEAMEDELGLDDKTESQTTDRVRWKKKKNARMRVSGYEWRSGEVRYFWCDNVVINFMRRTHYQSGKRSRGRNRPS